MQTGSKEVSITVEDEYGYTGTITKHIYYIDATQFENFTLNLVSNRNRTITATDFSSTTNTMVYTWTGDGLQSSSDNNANVTISGGTVTCTATQTNNVTNESIQQTLSITINTPTVTITGTEFVFHQENEYKVAMNVSNLNGSYVSLVTGSSSVTDGTVIRYADDNLYVTFDTSVQTGSKEVSVTVEDEYGYQS